MTILDEINQHKLTEIETARSKVSIEELTQMPLFGRQCNSLKEALLQGNASGIIAEFKTKSPSKGIMNDQAEVAKTTSGYVAAGVSGLSVLTDARYFGGSLDDLLKARKANPTTPILRKDFMLDPYQVYEAKAYGADLILLIAASLSKEKIEELTSLAKSLGMEVLMEIHDAEELGKLHPDVDIVGVNNRSLKTFQVDVAISAELANKIPKQYVKISESGLKDAETILKLKNCGFQGFLMGETFMKTDDPGKACSELIERLSLNHKEHKVISQRAQSKKEESENYEKTFVSSSCPSWLNKKMGAFIKVCGMRDPENIRKIASLKPDYMGFIFYPASKRFVGENPSLALFENIPESIQKVGVFVNEQLDRLIQICNSCQFSIAQLHGSESPGYCQSVKESGIKIIKAFSVGPEFDFQQLSAYEKVADYFLFDTKADLPGGTGQKFDWNLLENYQGTIPFFLSGGIGPDDLPEIQKLQHPQFYGVDINSGFELSPALKDAMAVERFMNDLGHPLNFKH